MIKVNYFRCELNNVLAKRAIPRKSTCDCPKVGLFVYNPRVHFDRNSCWFAGNRLWVLVLHFWRFVYAFSRYRLSFTKLGNCLDVVSER